MDTLALSCVDAVKFWSKVEKTENCWVWVGNKRKNGYGSLRLNGKNRLAHRVSWTDANGTIPEGMQIDHVCHNRACVNPSHLRLATNKQNAENRRRDIANSASGVLGVSRQAGRKKWKARVEHEGHEIYLGCFDTIEEAEASVTAKRLALFTHNDADRTAA